MHNRGEVEFSFIIPCFNEEGDIEKTILACLCQETARSFEIICIDDGSKDRTAELIEEITTNYENIYLIKNIHNYGVSYARNLGALHSRGKILIFLNADELPNKYFLEKLGVKYCSGADYVFPKTCVNNSRSGYGMFREIYRQNKYIAPNSFMWSQGFSCKKELFDEVGGFSTLYPGCGGEDWDFVSKIDLLGKNRCVDLNNVVYHNVPERWNQIVWHMYNRGRGCAYYDMIYRKKSICSILFKVLVFIGIIKINAITGIFLGGYIMVKELFGFLKRGIKMYGFSVKYITYFTINRILRFVGYYSTFLFRRGGEKSDK